MTPIQIIYFYHHFPNFFSSVKLASSYSLTARVIIGGFFFNDGAIQDQKTSHHKTSLKCEFKVGKDEAFTRLMQLILLVNYSLKICT